MTARIRVNLGQRSYPVIIESGKTFAVEKLIQKQHPQQIFAIFDAQLFALHGKTILKSIRKCGLPIKTLAIPIDENCKSARTLEEVHHWLLSERISRSDFITACGGGVTTDIVGFAAATIMRGIDWGAVPTTLIGMIDAAIGGKTGINHSLAKNAIGAFWQPRFVYAYTPLLYTLPPRQLLSGAGELVKYAGLIGEPFVTKVRSLVGKGFQAHPKEWETLISKAGGYKSFLVSKDERDTEMRRFLNLGHTFAHGIEQSLGYGKLLHGEAVAIGLLAACNLSTRVIGSECKLNGLRDLVESIVTNLPIFPLDSDRIIASMQLDKKRSGASSKFVLLKRPGKAIVISDVKSTSVRQSLTEAIAFYRIHGGRSGKNTRY